MLVSKCCQADLRVVTNDDCSYYVCVKCDRPTDERCSFELGEPDAEIQQ